MGTKNAEAARTIGGRSGVWLVAGGAALLAFQPIVWLVRSWTSPTYNSMGSTFPRARRAMARR